MSLKYVFWIYPKLIIYTINKWFANVVKQSLKMGADVKMLCPVKLDALNIVGYIPKDTKRKQMKYAHIPLKDILIKLKNLKNHQRDLNKIRKLYQLMAESDHSKPFVSSSNPGPSVGVGVLVYQDNKILLGKRGAGVTHGAGKWACPGGHLELGESPEQCAIRELYEETGLIATQLRTGPWVNTYYDGETSTLHYVGIFIIVDRFEGVLDNKEPHKCDGWEWVDINHLPTPLFETLEILTQKYILSRLIEPPKYEIYRYINGKWIPMDTTNDTLHLLKPGNYRLKYNDRWYGSLCMWDGFK